MKKYIITAAILLLAAACNKPAVSVINYPTPTPTVTPTPDPTAGWNTYTSPSMYGFSIKYPEGFGFSTDVNKIRALSYIPVCDSDSMLACMYLIRQTFVATNFDGAGIEVSVVNSQKTASDCYMLGTSQPAKVTLNGTEFVYATSGEGAAGHFSNDRIYRSFNNNLCYQVRARIGQTNIGNYPSGTVQKFDENEVWQQLQGVVDTFEFTTITYTSKDGYSIKYPSQWTLNQDKNNGHRIYFTNYNSGNYPEAMESIEAIPYNGTVQDYIKNAGFTAAQKQTSLIIAGQQAIKVETGEFSSDLVILKHSSYILIFNTQGAMTDAGVINSLEFPQ